MDFPVAKIFFDSWKVYIDSRKVYIEVQNDPWPILHLFGNNIFFHKGYVQELKDPQPKITQSSLSKTQSQSQQKMKQFASNGKCFEK